MSMQKKHGKIRKGGNKPRRPDHVKAGAPGPALPPAKGGQYWLYGNHPVQAALANDSRRFRMLACTKTQADAYGATAERHGIEIKLVDRASLDQLFPEGTVHQGIAALVQPLEETFLEDLLFSLPDHATYVVLDQVTDPHNVGAILRTAAVFGADAVIMQDRHAPPESAVLAKSASGALETTPLVRVPNLARALEHMKDAGFWCAGLAGESETDLPDFKRPDRAAIVMGAEGSGLRRLTRDHCDVLLRIPMAENAVGSLNVSNAAAIVLYALCSR